MKVISTEIQPSSLATWRERERERERETVLEMFVYSPLNHLTRLLDTEHIFFSPGVTTPIGGCILQPSSGL